MSAWRTSDGRPAFSRSTGPLFRSVAYEAAVALLSDQKARLESVIAENAFVTTTNRAKRYLAKVEWWLAQPASAVELAPQEMGPNGRFGQAIDDVCREAEQHRSYSNRSAAA
jgi:hypothetical protein